ncbi:DUF1093 domain-containing protein [Lacticaseibacillus baoqingensis]|uniref:DUF1093 domain-containing protein n=1 Tax=Lacticaseibacillus baoqingensis TaxID=2486013 RepID=A0ABW4EAA3_9LACO|nr:DUF1093 domain-containing protein [Lacticaseibacillus baoqingensis]
MRKAIIGLIVLVIVVFGGYKAYSYWNTTYNGETAYAQVPAAVKHKSKTDSGADYKKNGQQVYYYEYDFTWANAKGETKHVAWEGPESTDPTPLAKGSYVTAKVSAKRVTKGMQTISVNQVPAQALKALQ